jgi:uncharacterized protein with von Willebrand factor type A (vWA) domain
MRRSRGLETLWATLKPSKSDFLSATLNSTLKEAPKMRKTENDISQSRRSELNALMNHRLSSAFLKLTLSLD